MWEFPIGFYVKLSSAVAAILVGGLKCQTQFWKGTTQVSFQQNLVEIGSVVKLCPVIPISNQDGHQAKHRKKGDAILKESSPLKLLSQSQPNFGGMILG
jgi:hypothetical protein